MLVTLKEARDLRGISIEQLAQDSGVALSTIYRLEKGETRPYYDTVLALERALGITHGSLRFDAVEQAAS